MVGKIMVLLVDDHPVIRAGLKAMLAGECDMEVVGEACTGEEALGVVEAIEPNVVLMDIRLPGMSGTEATRQIKKASPDTSVIMLTMYDSEMYVVEALRAGAAGYLTKDGSKELLCYAVRAVVEGGAMVRSQLLQQAIQGFIRIPNAQGSNGEAWLVERLSPRELDVIRLLSRGYSNRDILKELSLAEVTVKKHVQNIIAKLGVSDRTQAAIAGVRLGLAE